MKFYEDINNLEVGIDEVARGCLAGRVYAAAVIWPKEVDDNIILKDSKKLSKKRREFLKDYIEETAIDFSVSYENEKKIDEINILNATYSAMHKAISNLNVEPESIIVDGKFFKPYYNNKKELIPHNCYINGDSKYSSIAAASILAKVYHDKYVENLCQEDPKLNVYGWKTNMCYGTQEHIDAIHNYGITDYHRKTFGICKNYV